MLDVFRAAAEKGFSKRAATKGDPRSKAPSENSERDEPGAGLGARWASIDEQTLRTVVHDRLATLMNTVRLDAAVQLDDAPDVARSVVNFGFQDLSNLSRQEVTSTVVAQSIRQSLCDHEPRLVPESVKVKIESLEGDEQQRIAVFVSAELLADPADVPVEFQADVDLGAGKVILNTNRSQP